MARGQLDYSGLQYGVKSIGDAVQQGQKSQLEFMLNMKKQEQLARKNNMDVLKMWMDSEGKAIGNLLQNGKVEEATKKFEMAKQNPNLAPVFASLGIDMLSFEQKGKDVAIVTVSPMTEELQKKLNSNIPIGTDVKIKGVKDSKGNIDIYEAVPYQSQEQKSVLRQVESGIPPKEAQERYRGVQNLYNPLPNNSDADFKSYLDNLERRYGKKFDQAQINMAKQEFDRINGTR